MFTFMVIVTSIVWVVLILVTAMQPMPSLVSRFELERRAKRFTQSKKELQREVLLADVLTLRRIGIALLLVASVLLSVLTFGWVIGVMVAVGTALLYGTAARVRPIRRAAMGLYGRIEPGLLGGIEKFEPVFAFLRDTPLYDSDVYHRFDSREELGHLIEQAHEVLSDNERRLIRHALEFADKTVASVMTPRRSVSFIKRTEFLGPLVLDELHAIGHSRLPVVAGDLDHIVGILHLRDLLSLDRKRSVTAEKAMETKVYYVRKEDSLERALGIFLKVRHHLLIVVDDESKTVGIITLEDVIEALIGRRIVDEGDGALLD